MIASDDHIRTVEAQLSYVCRSSKLNRRWVSPGLEINTGTYETHPVIIRDGRPIRQQFTLDRHGFTLVEHKTAVTDFSDRGQIEVTYPAEAKQVLLELTGADRFVALGSAMRGSDAVPGGPLQQPAADVHVDISRERAAAYAARVYQKAFPGQAGFSRFIAMSYWRCLSPPPQDWPLAVCEGTSLSADEGVPNTMHVVDKMPDEASRMAPIPGEDSAPAASIFYFNPAHRWWYFSNMTPDEVLVLKFNDSDHSRAWRTPHTAFHDPTFPNAVTRRSIEFRSFVFFD